MKSRHLLVHCYYIKYARLSNLFIRLFILSIPTKRERKVMLKKQDELIKSSQMCSCLLEKKNNKQNGFFKVHTRTL